MGLFRRKSAQDRFAEEVIAHLRQTPAIREAVYDQSDFSIHVMYHGEEHGGRLYLENTFRECSGRSRAERRARIDGLIATVTATTVRNLTWEDVAVRLRPVVRGASFGQTGDPGDKPLLVRPALPYLGEFVVIDEPRSMAYVSTDHVREWGCTPEEVFAAARANLSALAADAVEPATPGKAMLHMADTGDSYFTSMLLLDGFLAGLAPRVGGRPVAFIPDRDSLIVIPDGPEPVARMLERAEQWYLDAPRGVSPMAYTCDDSGRVVPYRVVEPGRLADLVHRSEVMLAAAAYGGQTPALAARYEREGVDIFVGTPLVAERQDGTLFSVAVWPIDCPTMLPHADLVCFRSDTESLMVPWPVVARTTGLRPADSLYPERYFVAAWPDPAVLEQLRSEAVTP